LNDTTIQELVTLAQNGDHNAREKLIFQYKPFIYKTSCSICQRGLSWENDDELSIALIAFNEAVSSYNPDKGANFLTFARRVISQRLVDYFRHEKRHQHISLSSSVNEEGEENEISPIESSQAWEDHKAKVEKEELAQMMLDFEERLNEFGTSLDELADICPKHRDTREKLANVAEILCSDQALLNSLRKTKRVPAKKLARAAKVSKRVLENGRKYILAMAIIISEERFKELKTFIFSE